jgi:hypothetical protein
MTVRNKSRMPYNLLRGRTTLEDLRVLTSVCYELLRYTTRGSSHLESNYFMLAVGLHNRLAYRKH